MSRVLFLKRYNYEMLDYVTIWSVPWEVDKVMNRLIIKLIKCQGLTIEPSSDISGHARVL